MKNKTKKTSSSDLKCNYISITVFILILFFSSSLVYSQEPPIFSEEVSKHSSNLSSSALTLSNLPLKNETPEYHINATFHPLLHSIDAEMRFKIPKGFNKNHLIWLYFNIWPNGYADDSINITDVRNDFGTKLNSLNLGYFFTNREFSSSPVIIIVPGVRT